MKKAKKICIASTIVVVGSAALFFTTTSNIQAKNNVGVSSLSQMVKVMETIDLANTNQTPSTFTCPNGHENCDGSHRQNKEFCDGTGYQNGGRKRHGYHHQ